LLHPFHQLYWSNVIPLFLIFLLHTKNLKG
jgi:hypothetical protein